MDDFTESPKDPAPNEEIPRRQEDFLEWLQAIGLCAVTPPLHSSVQRWTCSLAKCEAMKHLEKRGKSALIDSFTIRNIPVGAHRGVDAFHDPLFGPVQFAREHGVKKVATVWAPHMSSDIMTKMSLPLPGTSKLGTDSLLFKLYAKGLVNVKTVIVAPGITLLITEVLVRTDVGNRVRGQRSFKPTHQRLQKAHGVNAVAMGAMTLGTFVVAGGLTPVVVAFGATSALSAAACGTYYAIDHRKEIAEKAHRVTQSAVDATRSAAHTGSVWVGRRISERVSTNSGTKPQTALPSEREVKPQRDPVSRPPSPLRLGIAAALTAGVIFVSS